VSVPFRFMLAQSRKTHFPNLCVSSIRTTHVLKYAQNYSARALFLREVPADGVGSLPEDWFSHVVPGRSARPDHLRIYLVNDNLSLR
jgi:hypothetical protein